MDSKIADLPLHAVAEFLCLRCGTLQREYHITQRHKAGVRVGILTVRLDRQEDTAILSIRDTGVGIPEDAIVHIFERFYRVDKARSRATGGSGLGLAIVKNIVQHNRGEIRVESTVGQGSCFLVSFPAFDAEVDR